MAKAEDRKKEKLKEDSNSIESLTVNEWSVEDVGSWLETHKFPPLALSQYKSEFESHYIDGHALLMLTEDNLKRDLKISRLGHVKKLLSAIEELQFDNRQHSCSFQSSITSRFNKFQKNSIASKTASCPSHVEDERSDSKLPSQVFVKTSLHPNSLQPSRRSRTYSSDSQADSVEGSQSHSSSSNFRTAATYYSSYWKSSGAATNLKPEYVKTITSCFYMFLVTWVTAIVMVFVHDRVPDRARHPPLPDIFLDNVPHISWAFDLCEITIVVLIITWMIILFFHKHRSILMRRFAALSGSVFLLRCATMFITSLSVPGQHLECAPRDQSEFWTKINQAWIIWKGGGLSIKGVRTCGDYMFSGHTTALTLLNFFITEYTPRRMYFLHIASWVLNTFGIFFILAAHEHYSIDVFIAFYITSRMFLYYHSLANNRALQQRDSFRTKIWFPMFSYFEANIDGIVPNEYTNPVCAANLKTFAKSFWRIVWPVLCRKFSSLNLSGRLHTPPKVLSSPQKKKKK